MRKANDVISDLGEEQAGVRPPLPAVNEAIVEGELTQEELLAIARQALEERSDYDKVLETILKESEEEAEIAKAVKAFEEQAEFEKALEASKVGAYQELDEKHGAENGGLPAFANIPDFDTILKESAKMEEDRQRVLAEREEKELQDAIAASQQSSVAMIFSDAPVMPSKKSEATPAAAE